jgi:hypothetical protein
MNNLGTLFKVSHFYLHVEHTVCAGKNDQESIEMLGSKA